MRQVYVCQRSPRVTLLGALLFTGSLLFSGCSSSFTTGNLSNVASISVPSGTVRVNEQLQLSGTALTNGQGLSFSVNGVPGGNAEFGTITSAGLYTAPAVIPSPDSVEISATSKEFPTAPAGTATLTIWNPIPVVTAANPSGFSEGTTTVIVNGSKFVYGAQIQWNGAAVPTTYVSSTQVAATISAADPGTFPLTVTNPDPGSASAKPISLLVGPGQVVLKLQAGSGSDVRVNNQLSFGLNVNGTTNTAVTLQVNGVAGGNAQIGTAVSNADGSITYTAPPVVPTPNNVVQLTVTSVDNPAVSITQNISVLNPIPILTSATPMSFNVGSATVVLTGQQFINGAQVLMNGAPVPTTFNSGSQLTAILTLSEPGNLDLQVLNPNPGPATSTDLIALVQGTPPVPVVSPEDASRFLEQATFGATDADIHHLSLIGYQAWLDEQFNMPPTPQEPDVEQALILNNPACAANDVKCNAALFDQNGSG